MIDARPISHAYPAGSLDGPDVPRVDLYGCRSPYSRKVKLARLLWGVIWVLLFRPSPKFCYGWRRLLLRLFGARIAKNCLIFPSTQVWAPWNLEMGERSCLGPKVDCYSVDRITLGPHASVSQYSFLCTASHDITDPHMRLTSSPIEIQAQAWVCAGAFVGPGVTIGEGAVVGARGVVTRDVSNWSVVVGNPAAPFSKRKLRRSPVEDRT